MKNKKLSIRISEADWQRFHEKAEQADMTLTEYITGFPGFSYTHRV